MPISADFDLARGLLITRRNQRRRERRFPERRGSDHKVLAAVVRLLPGEHGSTALPLRGACLLYASGGLFEGHSLARMLRSI